MVTKDHIVTHIHKNCFNLEMALFLVSNSGITVLGYITL